MKSLPEKLRSLGVQIGTRGLPDQDQKGDPPAADLEHRFPGSWQNSRTGSVFVVQQDYPALYRQGDISIFPEHPLGPIGSWAGEDRLDDIPLKDFVFIDTETTGLSGGTGTYTFLIGAGKFTSGEFVIKQFLMSDPADEAAQLSALEDYLTGAQVIVSYNGKAFDLPRLHTRYTLHGWPPPLTDIIHLDLLHLIRRLFRQHLPNCSLGTIEYELLKFQRTSQDVPGWQVAELYFEYVQTGGLDGLQRIIYHNEMDVLSMPAVLNLAASCLDRPHQAGPSHPGHLVSTGKFFRALGDLETAEGILRAALPSDQDYSSTDLSAIRELSFIYKKVGALEEAVALWKQAAQAGKLYACVELAKVYEHRFGQLAEAVHWTLSAKDILQSKPEPSAHPPIDLPSLDHRLSRLKRKIKTSS